MVKNVSEYMKDHIFELRRKKWRHDQSCLLIYSQSKYIHMYVFIMLQGAWGQYDRTRNPVPFCCGKWSFTPDTRDVSTIHRHALQFNFCITCRRPFISASPYLFAKKARRIDVVGIPPKWLNGPALIPVSVADKTTGSISSTTWMGC